MTKQGPRSYYSLPGPGTQTHLIEILLRRPNGITSGEAVALGIIPREGYLGTIINYLRVFCGYSIRAIGWDPGKKRGHIRYAITARHNWDMSIAEDLVANRERRFHASQAQ